MYCMPVMRSNTCLIFLQVKDLEMESLQCGVGTFFCNVVRRGLYRTLQTWSKLQTMRGSTDPVRVCNCTHCRTLTSAGWSNCRCRPGFVFCLGTSPARVHTRWACFLTAGGSVSLPVYVSCFFFACEDWL